MRLLLVFLIAMIYGLPELAAQVPSVAGVRSLLAPDGNEAHISLSADLTPRQSELKSTGAERFVGGVIVGAIAAMATVLADVDYNYSLLAYSLGSAGGVLIATAKRAAAPGLGSQGPGGRRQLELRVESHEQEIAVAGRAIHLLLSVAALALGCDQRCRRCELTFHGFAELA